MVAASSNLRSADRPKRIHKIPLFSLILDFREIIEDIHEEFFCDGTLVHHFK
jgi:hypothetical protein